MAGFSSFESFATWSLVVCAIASLLSYVVVCWRMTARNNKTILTTYRPYRFVEDCVKENDDMSRPDIKQVLFNHKVLDIRYYRKVKRIRNWPWYWGRIKLILDDGIDLPNAEVIITGILHGSYGLTGGVEDVIIEYNDRVYYAIIEIYNP